MVDCDLDQGLVGRVILLNHTQLDIAYYISMASQFMHSSHESHTEAIYGILLYLKFTPSNGILFQNTSNMGSEAYNDTDWNGSIVNRRSNLGMQNIFH